MTMFRSEDVAEKLGLTKNGMILAAMLSGGDYNTVSDQAPTNDKADAVHSKEYLE